jgi:hypothetical protein
MRLGESYVAGGSALNQLTHSPRVSRDIDLFHDSSEAVRTSWENDRAAFLANGYEVKIIRQHEAFFEALICKDSHSVLLQWAPDSAYRFFPLVEHPDFGLTLHPFDLATNKVLALVGRVEVRDWIDIINCHDRVQPLGYLAWAACGKDPGFSPQAILEQAARSARYTAAEVAELSFDGPVPNVGDLSKRWHAMLAQGRALVDQLPAEQAGHCVIDSQGQLLRLPPEDLGQALEKGQVWFHSGSLRGAMPRLK